MIKIYAFGLSNRTEDKTIGVIGDGEGSSIYRTKNAETKESIRLVDIIEFQRQIRSPKLICSK